VNQPLRASRTVWHGGALAATALLGLALAASCERDKKPPLRPYAEAPPGTGGAGGAFDPGTGGDCVAEGVCGHEVHKLSFDVPNVYFVFDRSGSMAAAEGLFSRYSLVHDASVNMVQSLGPLINVGAALFPHGNIDTDACTDGDEVLPITPGDAKSDDGAEGPTTAAFRAATNVLPYGGTPVSATLEALLPKLEAASGRTLVLLLTDGAPNCNAGASCTEAECGPNIEGDCPPGENCCSPTYPDGGPQLCVDRAASVDAVAAIAALGIEVYVIGIPGSEFYGSVLDDMAEAGGTAQATGADKYLRVSDLGDLEYLLAQIAGDAISCELPLDDPPSEEERDFINVYLDCDVVPYDPASGWAWLDDETIELHGSACQALKRGEVTEVHIATGCPTEQPK
jgi:hypothetical protein